MKNEQTHFFIVTPSYNQGKFIKRTVRSVIQQNCKTLYWVIDGKSNDGTVKILSRFSGIHWISANDAGQTDAINKGFRRCGMTTRTKGIAAYINSDDYFLPGAFRAVKKAFAENPDKMWLVGDCQIVNERGEEIQTAIAWYKKILRQLYFPALLHILNPFPQPAVFFRTEALQKVGKFNKDLHYVMDYEYWQRMQRRFGEPIFLHKKLAAFRIHQQSKGVTLFREQFIEQYQVACQFCMNPFLLFLHRIHNTLTIHIYFLIKKVP